MAQQLLRFAPPLVLFFALAVASTATTLNNDHSCDIGVAPAATLLLPHFEIDVDSAHGETTIFTITNVTNVDRIARVRFDEAENAVGDIPQSRICTPITIELTLPSSSFTSIQDSSIYPQLDNGAIGGWMYLNLDNCELDVGGSSNWVISSMRAEGRYSVDVEAAPLGNGCSAPAEISEVTDGSAIIGPRP